MSLTTNIDNIYKNGVIGNVRKAQEDCHGMELKSPNGQVFVVCDGMGGHVGGAKASSLAVESIMAFLNKEKYNNPIEALNGALQFANTQIIGYASEHPEFKGMGTTACVLLFQGDEAWIAHVGDSRIYLYLGKEKELHRITVDHSYVQMLVDKGLLDEEQAETDPNKNRILKALGVTTKLEPTFNFQNKPILPKNDDIFLICSDGLSGMIPDKTIKEVLSKKELSIEQKGDELIRRAMEGETVQPGGQDNCTVELIKVDNSPWKTSEFKSYNPIKAKGGVKLPGGKTLSPKSIAAVVVILLVVIGAIAWFVGYIKHRNNEKEIDRIKQEISAIEQEIPGVIKDTVDSWNNWDGRNEELQNLKQSNYGESIINLKQRGVEQMKEEHLKKVNKYKEKTEKLNQLRHELEQKQGDN